MSVGSLNSRLSGYTRCGPTRLMARMSSGTSTRLLAGLDSALLRWPFMFERGWFTSIGYYGGH